MIRPVPLLFGAALLAGCGQKAADAPMAAASASTAAEAAKVSVTTVTPVTFAAADGLPVSARLYHTPAPRALILLFHQAGSSKEEYGTIAPQLNRAGYDALAVDQRLGGAMFGHNETAARFGRATDYLGVLPDLEGALRWARAQPHPPPTVLWGSSYSASLVLLVAAARPKLVAGVVAFSPGEYLSQPHQVRDAAARVRAPVFVTSASDPHEIATAQAIAAALPGPHVRFVPAAGVHGASTLIAARNPAGAAANWRAVLAFLDHDVAPLPEPFRRLDR